MAKFTPHSAAEIKEMLETVGVSSIDGLFSDITPDMRPKSFAVPEGMTELEALTYFKKLAAQNRTDLTCFLGGGYYDHFIPAAVDAISSRPEFFTAYTPYQPEASQGTLRAIFEYQSVIARLTGLNGVNASLYDGTTALYEALAMAVKTTGRSRVVIDAGVHPKSIRVLKTYCLNQNIEIIAADTKDFAADREKIKTLIDDKTAAIILQNPNFFGTVDDFTDLFSFAREKGALGILAFYPLSLALLKTPAEMGADIAVGEGQSLGLPLSFGGPYLGVMAADKKYIRKMPGRIVGETVDKDGKQAFVLTLQAREQHIRREKATSNICSNQALCALRAVTYLALLGKEGLKEAALLSLEKADRLKTGLSKIKGVKILNRDTFNEFALELPIPAKDFVKKMQNKGIAAGLPASVYFGKMENILIVAATEKRTDGEIDAYIRAAGEVL